MSDAQASTNLEEENAATSTLEEESERVSKSKGKKKAKGTKKRKESVEEGEPEDGGSSRKKKGKGKKKTARKVSDTSDVTPEVELVSYSKLESNAGEASILDEAPKETAIIEIKDEKEADELQEVVVKKEEALAEGDNVIQEVGVAGESSGEEKTDEKKDSEGEGPGDGSKEGESGSDGTVRRRATLSDLRGESVDKGDGEQPSAAITVSEVYTYIVN